MKISPKIEKILAEEKIVPEELSFMLNHSAITSLGGFNRRYYHWLFKIVGKSLEDMRYAKLVEVGHGRDKQEEEHESCLGEGCKKCGWAGHIVRRISDKPVPQHEPLRLRM